MREPAALTAFRSSGRPGFSAAVAEDPRHVDARKLERQVRVRFAAAACTVATHEGAVRANPGDAIITGIHGEEWRVSRARFADKYAPLPPTTSGAPGTYVSRPYRVLALRVQEPFEVGLADGISRLAGRAGDWLVDYGDGSLGIVSAAVFDDTYEIIR